MSKQTLTITDNRTGQTIELPIEHDTIPAIGLRQLKVQADDFGMMAYDPWLHEYGVLQESNHLCRRRQGHSSLPGLSD